jgi:hypothetical protein
MSRMSPEDLEPAERPTHRILASVPPRAVPLGFRDAVMRRVANRGMAMWEWVVAAALALPSLVFLAHQMIAHGDEFATTLNNVMAAAVADRADAFFFIDGSTVLALALVGVASLIGTHAALVSPAGRASARR